MHILKTKMTKFDTKSSLPIHTGPFLCLEWEIRKEFCKKHDFRLEEHSETKNAFWSQRLCKVWEPEPFWKTKNRYVANNTLVKRPKKEGSNFTIFDAAIRLQTGAQIWHPANANRHKNMNTRKIDPDAYGKWKIKTSHVQFWTQNKWWAKTPSATPCVKTNRAAGTREKMCPPTYMNLKTASEWSDSTPR